MELEERLGAFADKFIASVSEGSDNSKVTAFIFSMKKDMTHHHLRMRAQTGSDLRRIRKIQKSLCKNKMT